MSDEIVFITGENIAELTMNANAAIQRGYEPIGQPVVSLWERTDDPDGLVPTEWVWWLRVHPVNSLPRVWIHAAQDMLNEGVYPS